MSLYMYTILELGAVFSLYNFNEVEQGIISRHSEDAVITNDM